MLRLLITDHNTESIANRLHISQNTVKSHHYHMYRKLGVNSKQEAINIRDQYFARYRGL